MLILSVTFVGSLLFITLLQTGICNVEGKEDMLGDTLLNAIQPRIVMKNFLFLKSLLAHYNCT